MGKGVKIEIMDTTLRDGEQTSGVSFVPHEKLMIARLLLEELKVDRVEVASARVSEGEFDAVKMICDWAARRNLLQKVEVLGFVDGRTSLDWIHATGCRVINLLCKGSLKHCTYQLKKTPEEHIEDILAVVDYANELDIEVNVYLEDWSNGMKDSPEYVFRIVDALKQTSIKRFMLPDTLGVLNPLQVIEFMRKMNYGGYCDNNTKEIVILNLRSTPDWAEAQEEVIQRMEKCTIRHELVHAFLNESGLQWNSFAPDKAWAKNEEMVDWFAIQFPKMYEAFRLAGGI